MDIVPGLAGGPRSPGAPPVCFGLFRGRPGLDIQAGVAARVKAFVAPAPGPKDHLHTIIGSTCTLHDRNVLSKTYHNEDTHPHAK